MNDSSLETEHALADEAVLVERSQRGDLDAFNTLVELHQRLIYNVCLRMLGGRMAAEDVTQEAFISAYRSIGSFRGSSFRAWLTRIAANACTDELRRKSRRPLTSLDDSSTDLEPMEVVDATPGPEALALQREQRRGLEAALLRLPADQRLAVVMCDVQGFAYEEIAEAMGCSIGTVKSRIARGREKLRRDIVESSVEHSREVERQTR